MILGRRGGGYFKNCLIKAKQKTTTTIVRWRQKIVYYVHEKKNPACKNLTV